MARAFVHPSAHVDRGAELGAGSSVWHGVHVMAGARVGERVVLGQSCFVAGRVVVGDGCRVQNHVSLYDGVVLERDVFVGPSAVFTNVSRPRAAFPKKPAYETTRVGQGATVGANATIVCGVAIGARAFVGAGAVVTKDVPEHALVTGCPAKVVGWVCACGETIVRARTRPRSRVCGRCGVGPAVSGTRTPSGRASRRRSPR